MTTQTFPNRDKLFAKIHGELAFLDVALSALHQADIGGKLLAQMQRGVTAIRHLLRQAEASGLEAFACDLEDLLNLVCSGRLVLSPNVISLIRQSRQALARGLEAVAQGRSGIEEVQEVRDAVFSVLIEDAVTVKHRS